MGISTLTRSASGASEKHARIFVNASLVSSFCWLACQDAPRQSGGRFCRKRRQVRILFDRDFHERFLSKYPDEKGSGVIFVSKGEGPDSKPELEFKGHKMLLNLFADNKPDLSVTPHWTASLHAVWNLDTVDFDKVDFQPGPIELRPEE